MLFVIACLYVQYEVISWGNRTAKLTKNVQIQQNFIVKNSISLDKIISALQETKNFTFK